MNARLRRPDRFVYLQYCTSLEEAKQEYKKQAVMLHPDKGGKLEDMQQLNLEWDYIKKVPVLPITVRRPANNQTYTQREQPRPQPEKKGFDRYAKATGDNFYSNFSKEQEEKAKKTYYTDGYAEACSDEQFQFIFDNLYNSAITRKKKVVSAYYNTLDFLKENSYGITERQLKYVAEKLGYAKGWVYYQKLNLEKEKGVPVI